jgi:hypothetical protein
MIITIHEGSTFYLSPTQYMINALNASIDTALDNLPNYAADMSYICTSLYTTGTLTFTAGSSNVVGSAGASFGAGFIGRTLHVMSGANTGIYAIVDSTSSSHIRVARTGKTGTGENDVLANQVATTGWEIATWQTYSDNSALRAEYQSDESVFRTQFLGKDYRAIRDEAFSFIKKNYGTKFNNFMTSDLGVMLVETMAYEIEGLSWYLDYVANELCMSDAKEVSSISKLSRYLGYKPTPMTSSATNVTVTLSQGYVDAISIAAGTQLTTPNGVIFELDSAVNFSTDSTAGQAVSVGVTQGEKSTTSFLGTGDEWQKFKLDDIPNDKELISGSVVVTVNGTPWNEVELFEFTNTQDFEVDYVSDPPVIKFGNGVAGQKPTQGATIQVTKRVGVGAKGNVASGSITEFVTPPQLGGVNIKLTVTNANEATGGADPEDIESIRANAPRNFLTSDRAVTQTDWDTLATAFSDTVYGSVGKAKARVVRELAEGTVLYQLIQTINGQTAAIITAGDNLQTLVRNQTADVVTMIDEIIYAVDEALTYVQNSRSQVHSILVLCDWMLQDLTGQRWALVED